MLRMAAFFVMSAGALVIFGCGHAEDENMDDIITRDFERSFAESAAEDAAQRELYDRLEEEDKLAAQERAKRDAEEEERKKRNEAEEQKRLAALCPEFFADLRVDLKVTPSASVKKLLGDYSVELLPLSASYIDPDKLRQAIAAKKWLEVINIIQQSHDRPSFTEYPDERTIARIRGDFYSHSFLVLLKTKADLSYNATYDLQVSIHAIGHSHRINFRDIFWEQALPNQIDHPFWAHPKFANEYYDMYINGIRIYAGLGYAQRQVDSSYNDWTRHPDGIGWYFNWRPIDGEIILVPNIWDTPYVRLFARICG